ncbi:MAG: cytidine deaminase [Crocinitomicaceae bacterium]|jgi:cytidine deaminase|nr:cytidine deaminase [Crocinitomicaceae bacterium]
MNKSITINYTELAHYNELDEHHRTLIGRAYEISRQAYAPYSDFRVGAVVELHNGEIIAGNNQENIAYPSGLCAERVALYFTGANFPNEAIKNLVVVAVGDLVGADDCISPCGSCRQVIAESERRQSSPIRITLVSQSGRTFIFEKISDLLLFPFGI